MKAKRIMGFFLSLVMFTAYLPLNPIASYADDGVKIDDKNFPDKIFRKYVSDNFDKNKDDTLSKEECDNVKDISINVYPVQSLKGIEHFENLTELNCSSNYLESLNLSKNTKLTSLNCERNNYLEELDVSKNTELTKLYCNENDRLGKLDITKNTKLTTLYCNNTRLKKLNVDNNTALTSLNCARNQLTSLNVDKNTALTSLNCGSNQLTSLNVDKNTALTSLNCESNYKLEKLGVSNNTKLTELDYARTNLKELDVSKNTELTKLHCNENDRLEKLDLSNNTKLKELNCARTKLTSLDLSKNIELTVFHCYNTKLTSLDLRNNTKLTVLDCDESDRLEKLDLSKNTELKELYCARTKLTSLDLSNNTKLIHLECYENQLKGLDLSKNTELKELNCNNTKLTNLDLSQNKELTDLNCSQNKLEKLDVSGNLALKKLNCSQNNLGKLELTKNKELTDLNCSQNNLEKLDVSGDLALTDLNCSQNKLEKLDLSNNTELSYLFGDNNPFISVKLSDEDNSYKSCSVVYTVEVEKGSKKIPFDKLPKDFDKNRIKPNVKLEEDGFTWDGKDNPIKFSYQLYENPNGVVYDEFVDAEITVKQKEAPVPTPTDKKVIGPVDPTDPNGGKPADTSKYYTVTFETEDETKGTVSAKNTVYVLKTETKTLADITAPEVTAKEGYEFDKWEPTLDKSTAINKDLKVKAQFKKVVPVPTPTDPKVVGPVDPTDPNDEKPADASKYWTVTFETEDETKGTVDYKNTVYVLKTETKTLADITAPKVTAKEGYEFDKWEPALTNATTINKDLKVKAYFKKVKEKSYNKKQQVANNSKMPKTANSMNIELYTVFMILSVALLVIAVKKEKRVNR